MTRLLSHFALAGLFLLSFALPVHAQSDHLVVTRNIRAGSVINPDDLSAKTDLHENSEALRAYLIGKAAKRSLYKNSPIGVSDVEAPKVIERNALVRLEYANGMLNLSTSARALDAGAVGDVIRVMNLSSKTIVTASVAGSGKVVVK